MKKTFLKSAVITLLLILLTAPQVLAMEIVVDRQGTVHFYESRVLGDDDQNETPDDDQAEIENEVEDETEDEAEDETENDDDDKTEIKTEVRTIDAYQRKQFEFKRENDGRYKIEIQDGKNKLKLRGTGASEPELVEADSVDLNLPLRATDKQQKERQLELLKKRLEKSSETQSLNSEQKQKLIEERQERMKKYYEKISEDRSQDKTEQLQVRSVDQNGGGFELESRAIKAKLKGADFNYDQESGDVSIITPSGQEHTLTHLPDEAVARMSAQGFFVDSDQEVEIETSDDESVQYKVQSQKTKKLFGLFNRQVEAEVVLDDLTGEVIEQEVPATDFWSQFLNRFSY